MVVLYPWLRPKPRFWFRQSTTRPVHFVRHLACPGCALFLVYDSQVLRLSSSCKDAPCLFPVDPYPSPKSAGTTHRTFGVFGLDFPLEFGRLCLRKIQRHLPSGTSSRDISGTTLLIWRRESRGADTNCPCWQGLWIAFGSKLLMLLESEAPACVDSGVFRSYSASQGLPSAVGKLVDLGGSRAAVATATWWAPISQFRHSYRMVGNTNLDRDFLPLLQRVYSRVPLSRAYEPPFEPQTPLRQAPVFESFPAVS